MSVTRWWRRRFRREPEESSVIDVELMRTWTGAGSASAEKPASVPTPAPSKTRIAREVLVAVLTEAGGPLTRSQALRRALANPEIEAAGVSEGTLSAQLTAAVAEEPPRIVRIGRGVYAATDLSAPQRLARPCT